MAVTLGQAFVTIEPDTKGFGTDTEKELNKELAGVGEKAGRQVSDGLGSAFKKIGTVVAAAGVGAFFKSAVDSAGDLNEQVSKVGVVFGDASGDVLKFGDNANKSIGASKIEALTAAGTFGNLLRSVGLTGSAAADMSIDMVQLAGDLASFNNVPIGQALDAIRSGLVGETEPLKAFGVNLNEAALKAEAMRLGLSNGQGVLDASAKAQAAYSLILKSTTLAQGDFERTSGSLANQQRTLSAEFSNAKTEIGQALLPAMLSAVGVARDLLPAFEGVAKGIAGAADAAGVLIGPLGAIAGSPAGTMLIELGVGATGAFLGISKVVEIAGKASKAVAGLETAFTATNVAMAGVALGLGLVAAVYLDWRQGTEEAAQAQADFNEAVLAAGDPAAVLASRYAKLADALSKLDQDAKGTQQSLAGVIDKKITDELGDLGPTMERVGLSFDQARTLVQGSKAEFDAYLGTLRQGNPEVDALAAKEYDLAAALGASRNAIQGEREEEARSIKQGVEALQVRGVLTQSQIDAAAATAKGTDATSRWLAIGQAFQAELAAQEQGLAGTTGAATDSADAMGDKGSADEAAAAKAEIAKASQDRLKQALQEQTAATDAAKRAQDEFLLGIVDWPAAQDAVTSSVHDLTAGLKEQNEKQVEGAGTFDGNTEAALKNRDAFREVISKSADAINKMDDLHYTVAQATTAQQNLAQSAYDEAIALGAPESVAARLRDTINGIKPSVTTDVAVTSNAAQVEQEIDNAAAHRDTTISVSLQQAGGSQAIWDAIQSSGFGRAAAQGAYVPHSPGGSLWRVGEGSEDEAIVPLGRNFAANLARIVGPGLMGQVTGRQPSTTAVDTTIVVNIANAPVDRNEAKGLGRIVGESAAHVLAQRQLNTSVRLGLGGS